MKTLLVGLADIAHVYVGKPNVEVMLALGGPPMEVLVPDRLCLRPGDAVRSVVKRGVVKTGPLSKNPCDDWPSKSSSPPNANTAC